MSQVGANAIASRPPALLTLSRPRLDDSAACLTLGDHLARVAVESFHNSNDLGRDEALSVPKFATNREPEKSITGS